MRKQITILILGLMLLIGLPGSFFTQPARAAPINQSPVLGQPNPANGSTGNPWNLKNWNIPLSDPEGDRMTWSIECNNGAKNSATNAFNGSIYLKLTNLVNGSTYKVWVNATDPAGSGQYIRKWFTFSIQTEGNNPPVFLRAPSPDNNSVGSQLSITWSIRINDLEGNPFNWTINCSNGQTNKSTSPATNGTKSLLLMGLTYETSYTVWVNVTDPAPSGSGITIRRWYTFTTKANEPPTLGIPSLLNGSKGHRLTGLSWNIPINDPEGHPFNWRIQCSNGASSSDNGASNGSKALSLSTLTASTTYTVWVNATDPTPSGGGQYTRQWFTFTTQKTGQNNPPVFGAPSIRHGSTGNRLYPRWSIPINDPEGTPFYWEIECSNGQSINETAASNGTKSLAISALSYSSSYTIWVNATDPTGSNSDTRRRYSFSTESKIPLTILNQTTWPYITSDSGDSAVNPSIADLNNDGVMEIIRAGEKGIVIYNGKTGAVLWKDITPMWDHHIPLEIIDVNKDGYLDIISSYQTGTRVISGKDYSILWYNPNAPLYNKHAAAGDINGDGYPEIFVATSGPGDGEYPGSIIGLDWKGNIFAQAKIYFPCYGGLTLGDTDYDGRYEVYLCERNVGYNGTTIGKGVVAFWASNLTERWSHPEMISSSHCPTLVDTNKDGILDVVALHQRGGIAVFNSADGTPIHQTMRIPGLSCHSQPTIYDIDGDGNLEIIVGGGSDSWGKPLIWDLYTWSPEAWLPWNCWEPPAIADLNGDGRVEILLCTIKNISIFDDNYVFRGSIPLDNNRSGIAGWYGMSMIMAQDIDNDNKIELVLNRYTRLYAYETDGAAPTPRALSQFMYYNPHRGRIPYYLPMTEFPANRSTDIPYNPQLSVYIYNNYHPLTRLTFRTNASGTWRTIGTPFINPREGTYTVDTSGMNHPEKDYWWNVTMTDTSGKTIQKVSRFRTLSGAAPPNAPPYTPGSPSPANIAKAVSITPDLSWTGGDPDGDPVTYDVYFGTSNPPPKIQSNQTTLTYDLGTLNYFTTYYWRIVAWDTHHLNTTGPTWWFTTKNTDDSGGGGGGYFPPAGPQNKKPVANASAGEPYQGFINSQITFDGSKSYDPDGNITSWSWNFGDDTNGTGMKASHTFSKTGIYKITLIVTDNDEATGSTTTTCTITQPNRPPSQPNITGPINGTRNTNYTYTMVSTDADNDTIRYSITWGDETSETTTSDYLPSDIPFTSTHRWTTAGIYTITAKAFDNQTESQQTELTVLIDVKYAGELGYLIDQNGDGVYNKFYSNSTMKETNIQRLANGSYLIDSDNDETWDHIFDPTTSALSVYHPITPGFELILAMIAVAFVLFWRRKSRKRQ